MSQNDPAVRGGHVDLDALADLDEGLVDPPRAAAMTAHVEGCAECRSRQARLGETRAALRGLPPEQLPADVATRLDAALGDASSGGRTVVPMGAARRRLRHPTLPGIAAGFVAAALVAGIVVGVTSSHGSRSPSTDQPAGAAARPTAPLHYPITSSGRDYTKTTLPRQVPALLAAARSPAGSAASGTLAPVDPRLERLYGSRIALDGCVSALTRGGPRQAPLAVDFARFAGRAAVVVVLPGIQPGTVDAWVVGPQCDAADEHLLYYRSLPRPAG